MRVIPITIVLTLLFCSVSHATCGDVDGNGTVNIIDALRIAHHAVGLRPLEGEALAVADVNADEEVDIVDALTIAQYAAGVIPLLECA
jgi:hypothetical protein